MVMRYEFVACAGILLAACGGDERVSNSPPPTGGGGGQQQQQPECVPGAADACTGETICIVDKCQPAFPRFYNVVITSGEASATKPQGGCWDDCSGPGNSSRPDLYVEVIVNGQSEGRTATKVDTWFGDWAAPVSFQLIPGSEIEMKLQDEDIVSDGLTADELILNCVADPVTPEMLRGGAVACDTDPERKLRAKFTPR